MKLSSARNIAESIVVTLAPHCEPGRCVIAGSIRRGKPEPRDIEVVCIPNLAAFGLFGDELVTDPAFVHAVNLWDKVKGEPTGKYTQRIVDGVKLDLFMPSRNCWGNILAIRTGSARFSHEVLANTWVRLGFKSVEGMLWRDGKPYPCPEETDLFKLLGIPWVKPEDRT